ncbi:MAG: hypothetical protein KGZ35_07375 [Truepera sp.]|nr:hypothetical protein [Truepera sp.]
MKSETRHITLALPKEKLETLIQEESDYGRARREFMEVASRGFDLGTYGKACWTRDELHER